MFYVRACFDVLGERFVPEAEMIVKQLEEEIQYYGIGSIGEYFDPDPPYRARGAISQAWSVAAALEIVDMVKKYK